MEIFESIYWDNDYSIIVVINLLITIILLASLRIISGFINHVSTTYQLKNNNLAFSISLAGIVLAMTIMLTGVTSGNPGSTFTDEAVIVFGYGILGIICMIVSRLFFDKVSMPAFSVKDDIINGNVAASIIDAGNLLSTAIVIRAVMIWVDTTSFDGVTAVIISYVISQMLLSLATIYRLKLYAHDNQGKSLQDAIHNNDIPMAIKFFGYRIGVAFAITAASGVIVYETASIIHLFIAWAFVSIIIMLIVTIFSLIATKFILMGIEVDKEIEVQHNLSLATLQAVIYVAVGWLMASLMI